MQRMEVSIDFELVGAVIDTIPFSVAKRTIEPGAQWLAD